MKPKSPIRRHTNNDLGSFLKAARDRLPDEQTGRAVRVEDMAKLLSVTPGFVYQVEQDIRKPKDGKFANWASAYGVSYTDMWKCLDRVPMNLVASLKEEPIPVAGDPFTQLTEDEKTGLLPFLDFVQWNIAHQTSENQIIQKDS